MSATPKLIIDVDTGIDDAWGLCLLMSARKRGLVDILGITCVNGNTTLDNVVANTARVLKTCQSTDIPMYKGATCPLIPPEIPLASEDHKSFHGVNGFGDVTLPPMEDLPLAQEENAVVALNRLTSQHKGEVTLVCFAPLTNIALATRTFPGFVDNIRDIFVMGGNYTALGNTTMCAEFNAHCDPEAAHIVFSSFWKKLTLLPWETCLNTFVPYEWREEFGQKEGACIQLMSSVESSVIARAQRLGYKNWINCDQLLASIVINRKVIKEVFIAHATVELSGLYTRGQIVMDHLNMKEHNLKIVKEVDVEAHKELLLTLVGFPS